MEPFPGGLAVQDSALSLLWHRFKPWPGTSADHIIPPKRKNVLGLSYTFMLSVRIWHKKQS